MKKRIISLAISMLVLLTCAVMPFQTVSADAFTDIAWDFNDLGEKTGCTAAELSQATGLNITMSNFTASTNSNLSFTTSTQYASVTGSYTLPLIETGKLTASLSIKIDAAVGAWNLFRLPKTSGFYTGMSYNGASFQDVSVQPEMVNGGFKLRAEFVRLNKTDNWSLTVYDDAYPASPRVVKQDTINRDDLKPITEFHFFEGFSYPGPLTATFDDFSLAYEVLNTDASDVGCYVDFEGITSENNPITADYLTEETGIDFTSSDGVTIDGYNNVSFTMTKDKSVKATYNMPAYVQDGQLSVSLSFSQFLAKGVWHMIGTHDDDSVISNLDSSFHHQNNALLADPEPDGGSIYRFRAVYSRMDRTSNWDLTLYDDNANTVLYEGELSASQYPYFKELILFRAWSTGDGHEGTFDDLKVTYRSVEDLKKVGCDEDFYGITGTGLTAGYLSNETGLKFTATSGISISANNNVSFAMNAADEIATAIYEIATPVKTGKITASLTFEPGTAEGTWSLLSLYNNEEASFGTHFSGGLFVNLGDNQPQKISGTDAYRIRAEWARLDETSDWDLTLYDDSDEANPVVLLETTKSADFFDEVKGIKFFECLSDGSLEGTFDDLKVSYESLDMRFKKTHKFETINDFEATKDSADAKTLADATNGVAIDISGTGTAGVKDGELFVSYDAEDATQNTKAYIDLPTTLYSGVVSVSYKLSEINADALGTLNLFSFANANAQSVATLSKTAAGTSFGAYAATKNVGTDMYHLRAVIYRADKTRDWTVDVYDDGDFCPKKLYSATVAATDLSYIESIGLFETASSKLDFTIDDVSYTASTWYGDVIDRNVNFASFANGTYHKADDAGKFYEETDLGIFLQEWATYCQTYVENGELKVKNIGTGSYCHSTIREYFPVPIETGTVSVSMNTHYYYGRIIELMFFHDVNDKKTEQAIKLNGSWSSLGTGISEPTWKDGGKLIRVEISRESAEDNWVMTVYDDGAAEPTVLATKKYDLDSLSYVSLIDAPPLMENDTAGSATIGASKINVTYSNGTTPSVSLVEETDETGNLVFGDVKFASGGRVLTALPVGATSLTATVEATNAKANGEKFSMILAVYDKDNRLLNVAISPDNVPTDTAKEFSVKVSGFEAEAGTYAKAFIMKATSTLSPLEAEESLPAGF